MPSWWATCAYSRSDVRLCVTPQAVARQAPLSTGILQARILEWVAMPSSRGTFPAQGSNPGLLHCRRILYHLSHLGSPECNLPGHHSLAGCGLLPGALSAWTMGMVPPGLCHRSSRQAAKCEQGWMPAGRSGAVCPLLELSSDSIQPSCAHDARRVWKSSVPSSSLHSFVPTQPPPSEPPPNPGRPRRRVSVPRALFRSLRLRKALRLTQ